MCCGFWSSEIFGTVKYEKHVLGFHRRLFSCDSTENYKEATENREKKGTYYELDILGVP